VPSPAEFGGKLWLPAKILGEEAKFFARVRSVAPSWSAGAS
jgi:hypothetical protein